MRKPYLSNSHQASAELKYITENQAESYIEFGARQVRGIVQIKWSTNINKSSTVFYILRGTPKGTGNIKWDIIASIDNSNKAKTKFTYTDPNTLNKVYYRLMVVDKSDDIQYTSIFKVESRTI